MVGEIETTDPELRKPYPHAVKSNEVNIMAHRFTKFSDWTRLVRAMARLRRFNKEYKNLQPRTNETTTLEERKDMQIFIIKLAQEDAFAEEVQKIKQQKEHTLSKHKLHQLSPFLDENGVLRVGGRLSQSALHRDVKHPVILSKKSHVSALLIKHHHEHVHH